MHNIEKILNVPRGTNERLAAFAELLLKWNKKINLIGKATETSLMERHILDSAQLISYLEKDSTLTDFGSGAGFPGIILSLCGIKEVHLIESNKRKAAFLREASKLSENKIIVYDQRIEELERWDSDYLTSRALASLPKLLKMVHKFMGENTKAYFLKGSNLEKELAEAKKSWQIEYSINKSITSDEGYILEISGMRGKDA